MPSHNRTKPLGAGPGSRWRLLSAGITHGNVGRSRWANYLWREAAFSNDINDAGDGSTRIQTATLGDNPETAGETPTTEPFTHKRTTERSEGVSK
jgi:hypothetical protein